MHPVIETFIEQRPIKPHIQPQFVFERMLSLNLPEKSHQKFLILALFFNLHVLGGNTAGVDCCEGVTTLQAHPGRPRISWTWLMSFRAALEYVQKL